MFCGKIEILEFDFNNYQYNLGILDFKGVPAVVFVTFDEANGCWVGMDIPQVFRKVPDLLESLVRELAKQGYILLSSPEKTPQQP